jgi:hypothetical protein
MPRRIETVAKPFVTTSPINKIILPSLAIALALGLITGYVLASKSPTKSDVPLSEEAAKAPQQDNRTFRDFAEGTIKPKPNKNNDDYSEGTHILERQGANPVALTSSVVDLSKYEGKKVKVYGETQKAVKEGWLMDVGKVEEVK